MDLIQHTEFPSFFHYADLQLHNCTIFSVIIYRSFSIRDGSRQRPSQSRTCNACRLWFVIVLLETTRPSLETKASGWQHMLLQTFCINDVLTDVQVPHAMGTDTPLYQHRRWLFGPDTGNSLHDSCFVQKQCDMLTSQTNKTLCYCPSQMRPSLEKSVALLDNVDVCLLIQITLFCRISGE